MIFVALRLGPLARRLFGAHIARLRARCRCFSGAKLAHSPAAGLLLQPCRVAAASSVSCYCVYPTDAMSFPVATLVDPSQTLPSPSTTPPTQKAGAGAGAGAAAPAGTPGRRSIAASGDSSDGGSPVRVSRRTFEGAVLHGIGNTQTTSAGSEVDAARFGSPAVSASGDVKPSDPQPTSTPVGGVPEGVDGGAAARVVQSEVPQEPVDAGAATLELPATQVRAEAEAWWRQGGDLTLTGEGAEETKEVRGDVEETREQVARIGAAGSVVQVAVAPLDPGGGPSQLSLPPTLSQPGDPQPPGSSRVGETELDAQVSSESPAHEELVGLTEVAADPVAGDEEGPESLAESDDRATVVSNGGVDAPPVGSGHGIDAGARGADSTSSVARQETASYRVGVGGGTDDATVSGPNTAAVSSSDGASGSLLSPPSIVRGQLRLSSASSSVPSPPHPPAGARAEGLPAPRVAGSSRATEEVDAARSAGCTAAHTQPATSQRSIHSAEPSAADAGAGPVEPTVSGAAPSSKARVLVASSGEVGTGAMHDAHRAQRGGLPPSPAVLQPSDSVVGPSGSVSGGTRGSQSDGDSIDAFPRYSESQETHPSPPTPPTQPYRMEGESGTAGAQHAEDAALRGASPDDDASDGDSQVSEAPAPPLPKSPATRELALAAESDVADTAGGAPGIADEAIRPPDSAAEFSIMPHSNESPSPSPARPRRVARHRPGAPAGSEVVVTDAAYQNSDASPHIAAGVHWPRDSQLVQEKKFTPMSSALSPASERASDSDNSPVRERQPGRERATPQRAAKEAIGRATDEHGSAFEPPPASATSGGRGDGAGVEDLHHQEDASPLAPAPRVDPTDQQLEPAGAPQQRVAITTIADNAGKCLEDEGESEGNGGSQASDIARASGDGVNGGTELGHGASPVRDTAISPAMRPHHPPGERELSSDSSSSDEADDSDGEADDSLDVAREAAATKANSVDRSPASIDRDRTKDKSSSGTPRAVETSVAAPKAMSVEDVVARALSAARQTVRPATASGSRHLKVQAFLRKRGRRSSPSPPPSRGQARTPSRSPVGSPLSRTPSPRGGAAMRRTPTRAGSPRGGVTPPRTMRGKSARKELIQTVPPSRETVVASSARLVTPPRRTLDSSDKTVVDTKARPQSSSVVRRGSARHRRESKSPERSDKPAAAAKRRRAADSGEAHDSSPPALPEEFVPCEREFGACLAGMRVAVWWPDRAVWYPGRITGPRDVVVPIQGEYPSVHVQYDDGYEHEEDLSKVTFELLEESGRAKRRRRSSIKLRTDEKGHAPSSVTRPPPRTDSASSSKTSVPQQAAVAAAAKTTAKKAAAKKTSAAKQASVSKKENVVKKKAVVAEETGVSTKAAVAKKRHRLQTKTASAPPTSAATPVRGTATHQGGERKRQRRDDAVQEERYASHARTSEFPSDDEEVFSSYAGIEATQPIAALPVSSGSLVMVDGPDSFPRDCESVDANAGASGAGASMRDTTSPKRSSRRQRDTTSGSRRFAGMRFMLTGFQQHPGHRACDKSCAGAPGIEPCKHASWDPAKGLAVPTKVQLRKAITKLGGQVVDDLKEADALPSDAHLAVIARPTVHRTLKYLYSLARGLPPLHYRYVSQNLDNGSRGAESSIYYELPAGIDCTGVTRFVHGAAMASQASAGSAASSRGPGQPLPLEERALHGLSIGLVAGPHAAKWQIVITTAGATVHMCEEDVLLVDGLDAVVVVDPDRPLHPTIANFAFKRGYPMVTIAWVVKSLVHQEAVDMDTFLVFPELAGSGSARSRASRARSGKAPPTSLPLSEPLLLETPGRPWSGPALKHEPSLRALARLQHESAVAPRGTSRRRGTHSGASRTGSTAEEASAAASGAGAGAGGTAAGTSYFSRWSYGVSRYEVGDCVYVKVKGAALKLGRVLAAWEEGGKCQCRIQLLRPASKALRAKADGWGDDDGKCAAQLLVPHSSHIVTEVSNVDGKFVACSMDKAMSRDFGCSADIRYIFDE